MADALSGLAGDAIVAVLDWAWPRLRGRARRVIEHIVEAVTPDPPMTVRTLDGATFTGIVIADRGQVLVFIGTRVTVQHPRYFDDEPPLWRDDPFRR